MCSDYGFFVDRGGRGGELRWETFLMAVVVIAVFVGTYMGEREPFRALLPKRHFFLALSEVSACMYIELVRSPQVT